jgi:hypothetical protein
MRAYVVQEPTRTLPRAAALLRAKAPRLFWAAAPFILVAGAVAMAVGLALTRLGSLGERMCGWAGLDPWQ